MTMHKARDSLDLVCHDMSSASRLFLQLHLGRNSEGLIRDMAVKRTQGGARCAGKVYREEQCKAMMRKHGLASDITFDPKLLLASIFRLTQHFLCHTHVVDSSENLAYWEKMTIFWIQVLAQS